MSAAGQGGIEIPERVESIAEAHDRLRAATAEMTEEQARASIDLPGWTRGHVLTHLADLSRAFARQARYAVEGRTVEVYDGGRPTRDRNIEANHGREIAWLRDQLDGGLAELEEAWSVLGAADWDRPCAYRDSTLLATQLAWWRETELHSVDLGIGYGSERWSLPLSAHVIEFLQPRLPKDAAVRIVAEDTGGEWTAGEGAPVVVRGDQRSVAAWISGRPAVRTPSADGPAGLPELNAWP
ncbi:maleylpyruvate isomerase family mycothiol-dependent enzyme [Streptosporangium carneum]|uniref:Maleylpyruvate isomerase n=1 Tax=Streptosporangium carneum TaxID=47481 RepID=A0A9W6I886_9ACTN|nr:maleylpyruvate isomerase family mycothiol-dependent enzyme [Streptosporangium carneum]GLK13191.1 maleylpyruvate isomerase [Streptosporangium carneum]